MKNIFVVLGREIRVGDVTVGPRVTLETTTPPGIHIAHAAPAAKLILCHFETRTIGKLGCYELGAEPRAEV